MAAVQVNGGQTVQIYKWKKKELDIDIKLPKGDKDVLGGHILYQFRKVKFDISGTAFFTY